MNLQLISKLPKWITAERVKTLLILFVLLWMASRLATYFWIAITSGAAETNNISGLQSGGIIAVSQKAKPRVVLSELNKLTLFGEGPKNAEGVATKEKPVKLKDIDGDVPYDAPKSRLPLLLTGLVSGGESRLSTAMLKYQSSEDSYHLNDALPPKNKAILKRVLSDRVIIRNEGRYESLILYDGVPGKAAKQHTQNKSTKKKQGTADRVGSSNKKDEAVKKLKTLIESRNAEGLQKVLGVTLAYGEDRKIAGYKIYPGKDKEMFHDLGLQKDDIIKSVNGVELSDPSKVTEIMSSFSGGGDIQLLVEQDGVAREINFSL